MKNSGSWKISACVMGALCAASVSLSQTPSTLPKGEAMASSTELTATVTKIDQKTREVTLQKEDGREYSFVAGSNVKNLAQVQKGDVVRVTYTEALAYEVKKGGTAIGATTTVVAEGAKPGATPAGTVTRQSTLTVTIAAIDPNAPSVTFKGTTGQTRTIKVRDPENLKGVAIGDTVEITYTEAVALTVEKAGKN